MSKSTDVLQRVLGALSEEDIAELNKVAVRRTYPNDTVVCQEGEMEHIFYVIESGMVTVTRSLNDGSEKMLAILRDGEFFGEMGLLDDVPRSATVRTVMECTLIEISEETFDAIVQRNPAVAVTLLKGITRNLREADGLTIAELQLKNQELAYALEELKAAQAELLQQERLRRDLEIASSVQRSILPEKFPEVNGFEFSRVYRSAREVGGDFYDMIDLGSNHYGLVVGDISGKSIQAAIFMAIVNTLIRREASETLSPAETMHRLHQQILKTSTAEHFVTIFYGIINTEKKTMRYVRAGHERSIVYRAVDKSLELLDAPGRFVGLWPDLVVEEAEVRLHPGDVLVCYSDGVLDAENARQETFGMDRLLATVSAKGHQSAESVARQIITNVDRFRGEVDATDDITILVAKVT